MWMCVSWAGLTWAHPCVNETSTLADVEMALERACPFWMQMLLGKVSFGLECGVMSNLSSQKIELVTADKFGGKLSLLLLWN